MLIHVLPHKLCLNLGSELLLTVLNEALTEILEAFIEVLKTEDNARSTSKGMDLSAPVPELGQEGLDKAEFRDHIQVRLPIDILEVGAGKLLVRLHHLVNGLIGSGLLIRSQ